jgi:4a-hydroxytetrahydrobiopterin dehydratase
MPERLDQALVESSLQGLPEWTGDTTRISRTVAVTDEQAEQLLSTMAESARAMNHDPDVERTPGELRIDLTTHSAGGVTALDIAMASHINDLVAHATGGPAEHFIHDVPDPEAVDPSQYPQGGEEDLVQRGLSRRLPD